MTSQKFENEFSKISSIFDGAEFPLGFDIDFAVSNFVKEIDNFEDFSKFVQFFYKNIYTFGKLESSSVEDYIGAFSMIIDEELSGSGEKFGGARTDLAKVAWSMWISLSTE